MIEYRSFNELREKYGVTTYKLIKSGISPQTIDNMKKSKDISTYTLGKLCKIYNCTPNDIISFRDT